MIELTLPHPLAAPAVAADKNASFEQPQNGCKQRLIF
jgi:hypothetical protein